LLFVSLIVVWGMITVQVVQSFGEDEEENVSESIDVHKNLHESALIKYVYQDNVRDPFQRKSIAVKRDTSERILTSKATVPEWVPPPMRLTGILINNTNRVATIESNDGGVAFLHEGDTLKGMRVLKIKANSVSFSYQKKTMDWMLEQVSK